MAYELREIGNEKWLVEMPDSNNEIDDLNYALSNLYLHRDNENLLLKLPTGNNENVIIFKLMTSLLYEAHRHDWNSPPCLYRRIAM